MIERLSAAVLGSTLIFGLLFGSFIWVLARMVERRAFFREREDNVDRVGEALISRLRHGDFPGADLVLAESPSLEAAVVRPALSWLDGGPDAVEAAIDGRRIELRRELERSVSSLGIIGRQAPWVGLLGIVISLIDTLRMLDQEHAQDALRALGQGIYIGLASAGAGIIVGSIATTLHDVLVERVLYIDSGVAVLAKRLLALLRFNSQLAREFGLSGNGDGANAATAIEEQVDRNRPIPLAELD